MSSAPEKVVAKASPDEPHDDDSPKGWLSWAVGWVMLPATVLGLIWGGGVLVGVHLHDSWLSSLVVWFVELFS